MDQFSNMVTVEFTQYANELAKITTYIFYVFWIDTLSLWMIFVSSFISIEMSKYVDNNFNSQGTWKVKFSLEPYFSKLTSHFEAPSDTKLSYDLKRKQSHLQSNGRYYSTPIVMASK